MTFYVMASEMAGFDPSDSGPVEYTTGSFDAGFSRAGTDAINSSSYISTASATLPDDFFLHFAFLPQPNQSGTHTVLTLVNGTDEVFRIRCTGGLLQMQVNISTVWTNLGAAVLYSETTLNHVDLYIQGNSATGTATLFLGGTQRESASGNLSAVTSIDTARFYGVNNVAGCVISQVFASDESTIGGRLFTVPVSGAGATSGWTGTYAEIDETVYSDADFINSATASQVSTFAVNSPSLTGYSVRAVGVYARAKRDTTGPQNLQLVLRVSGADYFSSTKALGLGYASVGNIWDTNPASLGAWTNSPISSIQIGVKSIA